MLHICVQIFQALLTHEAPKWFSPASLLTMARLLLLPEYFGPCWMVERDPACVLRAACRARGGEALLASKYVPRQQEHRAACINKRTRNVYITINTPER